MVRIPGIPSASPSSRPVPAFARGAARRAGLPPAAAPAPVPAVARRRRGPGAAYTTLTGANGLRTYLDLRSERLRLEREVADLQRRRAEIETGLVALRDTADTETLERIAREKYRMRRPQEKVIEIVGEDALAPAPGRRRGRMTGGLTVPGRLPILAARRRRRRGRTMNWMRGGAVW